MKNVRFLKISILPGVVLLVVLTTAWGNVSSRAAQLRTEAIVSRLFLPLAIKPGLDLSVSAVKVIQGTSVSPIYEVYVAGRATTVRVFVGTGAGGSVSGVTARLCGYAANGASLGCINPSNGPITAPSQEGNLASTLNFPLPANWIQPGVSYHIDLDPDKLTKDPVRSNNRYPLNGRMPFNFKTVQPLNIMVVPVDYRPYPNSAAYYPQTNDLSYLTHLLAKLLPVAEINYQLHPFYTYLSPSSDYNLVYGNGWIQLLTDLNTIHNSEDPVGMRNYFGLVNSYSAHGCSGGCITGIGFLGNIKNPRANQTAVGWSGFGSNQSSASETMVHELGHNFSRRHVQCTGSESNIDPLYPYTGGKIGQYGFDGATGLLYQPGIYADYMSYCDPTWTSDYTYWHISEFLNSRPLDIQFTPHPTEALYVSGWISPEGDVNLRPIYSQQAQLPVLSEGSHVLELLGSDGQVISSYPFTPVEVSDLDGYYGFGFFLPARQGLQGLRVLDDEQVLVEKYAQPGSLDLSVFAATSAESFKVSDQAEGITLSWSLPAGQESKPVYRLRLSQDNGETWQVIALDWPEPHFDFPARSDLDLSGALLEIQASDGFATSTQVILLDQDR